MQQKARTPESRMPIGGKHFDSSWQSAHFDSLFMFGGIPASEASGHFQGPPASPYRFRLHDPGLELVTCPFQRVGSSDVPCCRGGKDLIFGLYQLCSCTTICFSVKKAFDLAVAYLH